MGKYAEFFTLHTEHPATGARAGTLNTAHGSVQTPVFMPVGTKATIKGIDRAQLLSPTIDAHMILANAYHLYLRPGLDVIKKAGGLHAFMGWPRALLTDSGGYQVFSLAACNKITDTGVLFKSPIDGDAHTFTPQRTIDIQRTLGADVIMPLDDCAPYGASRSYQQQALKRTQTWLEAAQTHFSDTSPHYGHKQHLFPIIQGGTEKDLRKAAARHAITREAAGYAIGGLSVGEPTACMYEALDWICPLLPRSAPRYLMGVGTPANLLSAIAKGVDMFDCVLPTRNARHGILFTTQGILNIRNAKWAESQTLLDPELPNPISTGYTRSYLRHLCMSKERLGEYLATAHNLAFYAELMKQARAHIIIGDFSTWMENTLARITKRC